MIAHICPPYKEQAAQGSLHDIHNADALETVLTSFKSAWMRTFATVVAAAIATAFAWSTHAAGLHTPAVQIGSFTKGQTFEARGYGILVNYADECLVVTLNHVAQITTDDTMFDSVAVISLDGHRATMADYVDYLQRTDIYVGRISVDSALRPDCEHVATLDELEDMYNRRMGQILPEDFQSLTLHAGSQSIALIPQNARTLQDARRGEPIRYTVSDCGTNDCGMPAKKFSGSVVSLKEEPGDRIILGLHQGRCGDYCSADKHVWQAVSLVTIYEHFKADRFPLKAKVGTAKAVTPSEVLQPNYAQLVQHELARLNCEPGEVDGKWGPRSAEALKRFSRAYRTEIAAPELGQQTLSLLRERVPATCPPTCDQGFTLRNGSCQKADVKTPSNRTSSSSPKGASKPKASNSVAKPAPSKAAGGCITVNGMIACP